MSVQFGRWNFDGKPVDRGYLEKAKASIAPYGPDDAGSYSAGNISILYHAFQTTKESRRETQPHATQSGAILTWDGRLDNRANLIRQLRDVVTIASTDVEIVAAAYEFWGSGSFAMLIGDWALSLWDPHTRSLNLAKDPIGTRHLYYSFDNDQVTWSTILDPLVLFAGKTFTLCDEYIAGWFSFFPAAHLTPYVGIHCVPPSSSVLLRPGKHTVRKYWDFDPDKRIRYRADGEYEEHFRAIFSEAVRRQLRSDSPILAELSGGMDSSSIVCMADTVIARGAAECPSLDTVSWYKDSDPDLDERCYFTKVEEKRGRIGCHVDLASLKHTSPQKPFESEFQTDHFAATPIPNGGLPELFKQYARYMTSQGHRVTLSGLAGESATGGGVPTPIPEFQDLLARARFLTLAHQVNAWAAKMRKRRLPLLWEAARGFFLPTPVRAPKEKRPAPWLQSGFVHRNHVALCGYPFRVKLFGRLPSFQGHLSALDGERRLLAYYPLIPQLLRDTRYPYLDRDLREFVYAIPWEQLVCVGQRRSLMRRALVGIVPDELRNRKRTPRVQQESKQEPRKDTSTECAGLVEIGQHMVSSFIGIIDPSRFLEVLQRARRKEEVPINSLARTVILESWLRHLTIQGVLTNSMSTERPTDCSALEAKELQAPAQPKSSAS